MGYLNVVNEPLYGSYRAFVEDIEDPLNLGRFKARVPFLHGSAEDITTEDLPWVTYCAPGLSYNSGMILTPSLGDVVMVIFEGGDAERPVYLGSLLSKGSSRQKVFGEPEGVEDRVRPPKVDDMPVEKTKTSKLLYKSPKGAMILIDEADGKESIVIKDARGSVVELSGGVVTISSATVIVDSNLYVYGDLEVSGDTKTYNIENTGSIKTKYIKTSDINTDKCNLKSKSSHGGGLSGILSKEKGSREPL